MGLSAARVALVFTQTRKPLKYKRGVVFVCKLPTSDGLWMHANIYMNKKFSLKGIINLGVETPKQIVVLQEERIIYPR